MKLFESVLDIKMILGLIIFNTLITIYFGFHRSRYFIVKLLPIVSSFFQLILHSLIFPGFIYAPILTLIYYIFISTIWKINIFRKHEDYRNDELIQNLKKIPELKDQKFNLKKYLGKDSLTAYKSHKNKIILGEELISEFSLEEQTFVIVHEIAHIKSERLSILIVIVIMFVVNMISKGLNYVPAFVKESNLYFLINLIIFIICVIGWNLYSWYDEYKADDMAVKLTKNKKSLKTALIKLGRVHRNKDYGIIVNLIIYDHPLIKYRLKGNKD